MIDFTGQSVIVTGAGRGLGREYALELGRRGAGVVVNDLGGSMSGEGSDQTVAEAVAEEIRTAGGEAVASHDSVDDPDGARAIVTTATETFGRLDAVINNAGIYGMHAFEDLTAEQWRRMLQVHLDGAFFVSQPAVEVMRAQGSGRLVFIASNAAAFGQEQAVHYATAKGGIIGMTNALSNECAPYGINVNAVLPVGRTRMMEDSMGDHGDNPVLEQFFAATTPERIVPLAVYLASRECTLTHHCISAVAGRYARVFLGLGEGWLADTTATATVEDIAEHLDWITATDPHTVPTSIADEIFTVLAQLGMI